MGAAHTKAMNLGYKYFFNYLNKHLSVQEWSLSDLLKDSSLKRFVFFRHKCGFLKMLKIQ